MVMLRENNDYEKPYLNQDEFKIGRILQAGQSSNAFGKRGSGKEKNTRKKNKHMSPL